MRPPTNILNLEPVEISPESRLSDEGKDRILGPCEHQL